MPWRDTSAVCMCRRGQRHECRAAATQANMTVAPVGEWESPITSELITASSISLGAPRLSPDGAYVYYLEGRPTEKGRQVLCRQCAPLQNHATVGHAVGHGRARALARQALCGFTANSDPLWCRCAFAYSWRNGACTLFGRLGGCGMPEPMWCRPLNMETLLTGPESVHRIDSGFV